MISRCPGAYGLRYGDATIPAADVLALGSLLQYAEQGIASRLLAKTGGGNLTLFAFNAGQDPSEHATARQGGVPR